MNGERDRSAARLDAMAAADREGIYAAMRARGADGRALQELDLDRLRDESRRDGVDPPPAATPDRLRFQLLLRRAREHGMALGGGVLEVSPDGFGFLRARSASFAPGLDDVYVSAGQLHHLGLRQGHLVEGAIRPPREGEQFFALVRVESVNGATTGEHAMRTPFEAATAVLPDAPLRLLADDGDAQLVAIAKLAPWTHGSRALVWAPESRARQTLLARIASAIRRADPSVRTHACLLDAEPLDAASFAVRSSGCEVVASTFDEAPARQVAVADLALAAAMRASESGARVVLLLDSMTALARNGNREKPRDGSLGPADVATHALVRCKRAFAAARQIAGGGSLTVVATMNPGGEMPIEREAAATFAQKGNSIVAFDSLDDDALPCPSRTTTRPEDLLLDRHGRDALASLRARLLSLPPERRRDALLG